MISTAALDVELLPGQRLQRRRYVGREALLLARRHGALSLDLRPVIVGVDVGVDGRRSALERVWLEGRERDGGSRTGRVSAAEQLV